MNLRVYCPAKVNLMLEVGARDARGYHPLRTVFQAVGLFDVLDVEFGVPRRAASDIEVVGAELPSENTVTKALRLSREVFRSMPATIRIEKKIPMQSGLGGGSSDAAGLLRALAHVEGRKATEPEIVSVAAAVGADVPFFLSGGNARGEGYGDRITPLPDQPEAWLLIAKPAIGCPTAAMYARLDEIRGSARACADVRNDFQRVAPHECTELIDHLRDLGASDAMLCGSGSAVFGRFASRFEAEEARAAVAAETWVVKTLSRAESLRIESG
ncbi:MAG TPA: 4-(cytidine 5'-diphospho)-2-C-methyl-D-erythritol kinase [Fimbriimonadaceae bacterium]|nr:4-(cytidine 5'-diphospho)-2-C-methyl-D-erythritol kinase [Fimbriimonadaceae bacterium]